MKILDLRQKNQYYVCLILAVSLIFSLAINAWSQDTIHYNYGNGLIASKGILVDGVPHGIWTSYYENGIIKSKGKWNHGILDSVWTFYYSTGHIKLKVSYVQGIKNGYQYEYLLDSNGNHFLKTKTLFIDGLKHGKQFSYRSNGNIQIEQNYDQNLLEGTTIIYDSLNTPFIKKTYRRNIVIKSDSISANIPTLESQNSNLIETKYTIEGLVRNQKDSIYTGKFLNGVPIGRHLKYDTTGLAYSFTDYDSTGIVISEGNYRNGHMHGSVTFYYYGTNIIKLEGNYLHDKRHGRWVFYYTDGKIEQQGFYKNGLKNREWIWFYPNGDTLRIENYSNNKLDGYYVEFDYYKDTVQYGLYLDNMKQEKWYENNGEISFRGEYFDDRRNKRWVGYYENQTIAFIGNFLRGNRIGSHIYYYKNGNLMREEYYSSNAPDRYWKYYDKNGNIVKIVSYKDERKIYIPN